MLKIIFVILLLRRQQIQDSNCLLSYFSFTVTFSGLLFFFSLLLHQSGLCICLWLLSLIMHLS